MARQRSLWSEFLRAQERQRQDLARERRQIEASARRAEQAMERAQRSAQRQARADVREQERLAHEEALAEAAQLTSDVAARVTALEGLLTAAQPTPLSFAALRRRARIPVFDASVFGPPALAPQWEDFAPASPPRGFAAMFGGRSRYEQALADAQAHYEQAVDEVDRAEADRQERVRRARLEHDRRAADVQAKIVRHNHEIDLFEAAYQAGEPDAVEDYVAQVLDRSEYPGGFPVERRLAYRPEPKELWIEAELPTQEMIPPERGFRYVKTRRKIETQPRPERERRALYASVIAQAALRHLREIFESTPPDLIGTVAFNGHVTTRDPATGQLVHPCLVSVSASRETFETLDFDHLKPVSCLQHLNAIVSPHPYDLEPVPPVVDFDLARYKFVDDFDAASELDGRPDLLDMDPFKFEHLIRQLFEKRGMTGWAKTTRGSRDDGVDAVAMDSDPILGGVCVIQAKRYKKVVPAESVRALWGTMEDKSATKGILVTTSWFGSSGRQFAANHKERLRLIEGPELKHLLEQHLGLQVRIGLDRQPPRRKEPPAR